MSEDGFSSESEVKQGRKIKEREELKRLEKKEDLKWVLSTERGRRFIWNLLAQTGIHKLSFHQHNGVMSFNEGMRNVGNIVFNDVMQTAPEAYFEMSRENQEREES